MNAYISAILSRYLIDRAGKHRHQVLQAYAEAIREEMIDRTKKDLITNDRLCRILNHAQKNVPFYRDKLRGLSILPENAREVLRSLPIIDRRIIQENHKEFLAEGCEHLKIDVTGGSTGTPMKFYVDRSAQIARESSLYWADSLAGWRYGQRISMLWGADKDVHSALQNARAHIRWWIENRRWYNAFDMSEAQMARYHKDMSCFKPHFIVAYASAVEQFALYLDSHNIHPTYPICGIITSAEMLTRNACKTIERVFQKPVFNRYGNREFGAIAMECKQRDGLHINERDLYLEIINDINDEGDGQVVLTYFRNYVQPFIRYNTEDLASWHSECHCTCGRTSKRLRRLLGRESDMIITKAGKRIHGEFFTHLLYNTSHVREFQFIQESEYEYKLLLVATTKESTRKEQSLIDAIREAVGLDARVEVMYVERIPRSPSGKRRFTISRVSKH